MLRINYLILPLVMFTIGLLAGCAQFRQPFKCTDTIGCVTLAPDEPLKIGVIQDLSGGAAEIGLTQARSIELAVAKRGNKLLGHPITLQSEDSQCLPEGGTTAALKVSADPQIVAILGTTCSGSAVTASRVMAEAKQVMVSGTNSAASLTAVGNKPGSDWQPGYFRTVMNTSEQGRAAAHFAFYELGVTTAATINDGDTFTRQLTHVFEQSFTEMGGKIVLSTIINKDDTDMHPVLTTIALSKADLLFFPIYLPAGAFIVQQSKDIANLENIVLMASSVLRVEPFIELVETDGVGMYFVGAAPLENDANNDLLIDYKAHYGESPKHPTYSYGYDAANLLLDAIEKVAVQDATREGTLHIGRQALREALYATNGFKGVTGKLNCNEFGDCGVIGISIVRLDEPAAGIEGLLSNVIYIYKPEQ